jgi:hypothetical protein
MKVEITRSGDNLKLVVTPENETEDCLLHSFHLLNELQTNAYENVAICDLES